MNKFTIIIIILLGLTTSIFANPNIQARTAILVDYHSDEVLYELEADAQIYPASMTKIMTSIVAFDLIYVIITLLSLVKCSRKGFVLSLLAAAKWLLAYVITLILFPRVKSYVGDVIDNEYILDIILGVGIFVIVIFC